MGEEVSGTSKGLLGTVEHLGDKGAKVAYHAAKKIEKKILHDEDRSGEQDAMEEVSGTSKGLLGTVEHLGDKGAKVAYHAAKKIEKKSCTMKTVLASRTRWRRSLEPAKVSWELSNISLTRGLSWPIIPRRKSKNKSCT